MNYIIAPGNEKPRSSYSGAGSDLVRVTDKLVWFFLGRSCRDDSGRVARLGDHLSPEAGH